MYRTAWIALLIVAPVLAQQEPSVSPAPAPPDLSNYDAPTLRAVCAQLYARVESLEAKLARYREAGDAIQLADDVRKLRATVNALKTENEDLRQRLGAAEPEVVEEGDVAEGDTQRPAKGANAHAYRYTYTLDLVGSEGRGRMTIRDGSGNKTKLRYTYAEYRDDVLVFHGFFRNASDEAARFSFEIGLTAGNNLKGKPIVIARSPYSTPILAPDEVHEMLVEIKIDPEKVVRAGIGNVRSFADDE